MGMKFLNKKSWHPATFQNQERVWKAEQKHKEEEKKMAELQKQVREEREREEFRQLQIRAGVMPQQERLDFLYESGLGVGKPSEAAPSTEEYLLGKPVQEGSKVEPLSKESAQPGALFQKADDPSSKNDAWRKLHSDPLLAIRQQEQAALAKIKQNPVQMMMLKQQADQLKVQKREEKRRAKEERRAERKRKREERKKRKRASSSDSESDNSLEDDKPKPVSLHKPEPREVTKRTEAKEVMRVDGENGRSHRRDSHLPDEERGRGSRPGRDERRPSSRERDRGQVHPREREEQRAYGNSEREDHRNHDIGKSRDRSPGNPGRSPAGRSGRGRLPERSRGENLHREREQMGRPNRGYSPARHGRSPEDRRYRDRGEHSRGGRAPQRDERDRSERSPQDRKRGRHDSSDDEAQRPGSKAGPATRGGEGEGGRGHAGSHVERRRHDSSEEDEGLVRGKRRHDSSESEGEAGKRKGLKVGLSDVGMRTQSHQKSASGREDGNGVKAENLVKSGEPLDGVQEVGIVRNTAHETEEVSNKVKAEYDDSDDEPGKLRGYGLIPGRGGLQLPAKRAGDAPPVPYKKLEEPAKPPPRVKHVAGKLTEKENAQRLAEMQEDASLHEVQRFHRIKKAAEKEDKEDAAVSKVAAGKSYLGSLEKSAYGLEKGGSVEDSIRRRTYFREKGPSSSSANAFRR